MMMRAPALLVVPEQSPDKTLADLVMRAKAQPGKLNYASGSAGYQLMAELSRPGASRHRQRARSRARPKRSPRCPAARST
jgi:hypothetical protein